MAAITPGTGGTLKSTTAEGAMLEILMFLQQQERDSSKNGQRLDYISGSFNSNNGTFSGGFQLKISSAITSTGGKEQTAQSYLTGVSYSVGTGSPTFKSTTAEGALFEVANYLQLLEADSAKNPNGLNYITTNTDDDTGFLQGTFSLPCEMTIASDGSLKVQAIPYLS